MSSASFRRMASVTATTKRPPAVAGGKRGAPVAHLAALACTPLDPLDPELRERVGTRAPVEALQTLVDDAADVAEGDVLIVAGVEYPVRAVADWAWRASTYRVLVLEQVKR